MAKNLHFNKDVKVLYFGEKRGLTKPTPLYTELCCGCCGFQKIHRFEIGINSLEKKSMKLWHTISLLNTISYTLNVCMWYLYIKTFNTTCVKRYMY